MSTKVAAYPPVTAPERRRVQVLFKVTKAEKKKYVAASERSGSKGLSEWIRTTLDRAAEPEPPG